MSPKQTLIADAPAPSPIPPSSKEIEIRHKVWCTLNRTTRKLSLWLYYRLFGKFLFHIANLS